jgi:hypothetical protein
MWPKKPARVIELVMPGLVPGIHGFLRFCQDVDGRDKPGHDEDPMEIAT